MTASWGRHVMFGLLLILVLALTSACDDSIEGTSTMATGESAAVHATAGTIAFLSSQIPGQIHLLNANGSSNQVLTRNPYDFESEPVWSPDGRKIAFVSDRDGEREIWVMNADGRGRRQLTHNDADEHDPDWSPDGRQIAFERNDGLHDEEIYVVNTDGTGERQLTANETNDYSPSWSPDGRQIAFASDRGGGRSDIFVMKADGTGQRSLTRTRAGGDRPSWEPNGRRIVFECGAADLCMMSSTNGGGFRRLARGPAGEMLAPTWSKDGRKIAFVSASSQSRDFPYGDIYVMNANGEQQRRVTRDGISGNPSWSPGGAIAYDSSERGRSGYTDKSRVWAMKGDGKSKHTLTPTMSIYRGAPAWSPDGRTLALPTGSLIHLIDAGGTNPRRLTRGGAPSWSPDGRRIAFEDDGIWIIGADGKGRRHLKKRGDYPAWSPHGQRIAFTVDEAYGAGPLYVVNANGTGTRRLTARRVGWFDWSPDGRRIAFATWQDVAYGDAEIYVINADGSGERQLTDNDDVDIDPQWSPDGRRIAFVSDRDSSDSVLLKGEIYVMDTDGENQRRLTHNSVPDGSPAWSPDGRAIAFVGGSSDGAIVVINADGSGVQLIAQNAAAPTWQPAPGPMAP